MAHIDYYGIFGSHPVWEKLDEAEEKIRVLEVRLDLDEKLLKFVIRRKSGYRDAAIRKVDWQGRAEMILDALVLSAQAVGETRLTLLLAGVAREAGLPASLAKTALKMLQDAGIIRHEIRDSAIGEIVEVELVLEEG